MRHLRGRVLVATLVLVALLPAPVASAHPMEVVADGLDNPRHLTVDKHGVVYVAEAGVGGSDVCQAPVPEDPDFEICLGATGAITRVAGGTQERVVEGLPSLSDNPDGFATIGPHDVTTHGLGRFQVSIGLFAPAQLREGFGEAGALLSQVVRVTNAGNVVPQADLAAFEIAENPDPADNDSNAYGLLDQPGPRAVVDASGNTLLRYGPLGRVSLLATFPPQLVPNPFDPAGPDFPMQSVPTAVVQGRDGAYYVSELTGFPFTKGLARIWRVVPGQEPEVYATGFTNLIDLDIDRHGNLYALELVREGLLSVGEELPPPPELLTGRLVKITPDGDQIELASEGLVAPGGVAVGRDGIYVTNYSVFPEQGQVVRLRP